MPRCFVTGCKSGYDSQRSAEKRHFFRAPRDSSRLQVWQRAIPRLDKQLTSSCVVCDLHFEDSDLVKEFVHNINGDVVIIPRDNWALKDDAVPRLFPNCPSYLSKPARKRKQPAVRRAPPVKVRRVMAMLQACAMTEVTPLCVELSRRSTASSWIWQKQTRKFKAGLLKLLTPVLLCTSSKWKMLCLGLTRLL